MKKEGKKVFVGLSGGVDSAVAAALLQREGYDVTGVFIKIWSPEFLECTWREDRLDAMRVAVHLGIEFREVDLSETYRSRVVSDMLEQYKTGKTPNPDVLCNEFIKFGAFADWAFENGADMLATGHYARIQVTDGNHELLRGLDMAKDQSYFLYRLSADILSKTLFPVGGFEKKEIRRLAREFHLPNAERPDSQGLCFVGDVPLPEFLSRFIELERGDLIGEEGEILGEHDGAALYTIGQRHGFRLAASAPEGPYYVTAIDTEKNAVHISKRKMQTEHSEASLSDMHWIQGPETQVEAVVRYHAKPICAKIFSTKAIFSRNVQLTPGQSLVFYRGDTCLGGAIIHSAG